MLRPLAILLCLVASSVFAQRPTSPKRLFLPIVGHTAGTGGAQFTSDLYLFNRGEDAAYVTLVFTPSGADGRSRFATKTLFIPARWTVRLDNVVGDTLFESGTGALEIVGDVDSIVARSSALETVRHAGTSVPAATEADAVGIGDDLVILSPVEEQGYARSNIGVAEIAGEPGVVRIQIASAFEIVESIEIPILPFSHMQVPVTTTDFWGVRFATVDVVSGGARVIPYSSLVENASLDAMYIRARRSDTSRQIIPIAAHFNGWWSEMWFLNATYALGPPYDGTNVPMTFYPTHDPQRARVFQEVQGGLASYVNSAVFSYFEYFDGAIGQIELTPKAGTFVTTRLSIPHPYLEYGSFGQKIDPVPVSHAVGLGGSVHAVGVETSFFRRTNLGITEVDGQPVTVRIKVLDAQGGELGSRDVFVAARGIEQIALRSVAPSSYVPAATVRFTVIGGTGRILAYASVLESASDDPLFVLAE